MPKLQSKTTVTQHHSGGKVYFRTALPADLALNVLQLKKDVRKQRLLWRLEKGKIIVEKR